MRSGRGASLRIWIVLSLAWFTWSTYIAWLNVAAIACGYPDTAAKSYPACFAGYERRIATIVWQTFLQHSWVWIVLPALALVLAGVAIRKFSARSAGTAS